MAELNDETYSILEHTVRQSVPMPPCNLAFIDLSESSSPSAGFTLSVMMHCDQECLNHTHL